MPMRWCWRDINLTQWPEIPLMKIAMQTSGPAVYQVTHTKRHMVSRLPSDKHTMFDRHKQALYVHSIQSFLCFIFLVFLARSCLFARLWGESMSGSHCAVVFSSGQPHFTGESLSWCPLRHVAYYCSSGKKFTDFIIYRNHPLWKGLHENRLLFWCSQFTVWRYLLGKCFLWTSYETC